MSGLLAPHNEARDRALFERGTCIPLDLTSDAWGKPERKGTVSAPFTAYDDVNVALIPSNATHVSYYANGPFQNLSAMEAHLPNAIKSPCLLREPIANYKQYKYWQHGLSIDVEPTLFTPARAAAIAKEAIRQGIRPRIYFPLSWAAGIADACHAIGLRRGDVELHSAHWTGVPHICSGITSVGWGTFSVDQTQYTDTALGRSLDANLCRAGSYGPWGVTPPSPPKHASGTVVATISIDLATGHKQIEPVHTGKGWHGNKQLRKGNFTFDEKTGRWKVD